MDVFVKLGIDWRLLTAQAVNFGILFFILRHFAYRPMLKFLEERTLRIEKGLEDAEEARKKLLSLEEKENEVLKTARAEAKSIITSAEISAKKRDEERMKETEERMKRLIEDARIKIEEEKRRTLSQAKEEIADIVTLSVEKILKEKIDETKDRELIDRM